jgi:hypothetical protein
VALATLCAKCPYTEGFVVFRARALFNVVYHTIEAFSDACNTASGSRLANTSSTDEQASPLLHIELYPNPNNGLFTIETDTQQDELNLIIRDVTGKEVYATALKIVNYSNSLYLQLKNGIYFVEIQSSTTQTKTIKKLVINN